MRVYHGSYTKIDKIDLSRCVPNKDFGQGFYVTKFRHHANEIDESQATDLFFNSKTFTQLAEDDSELRKKPWQEIYEMLKKELGIGEFNHEPHKPHEQGK